MCIGDLVRVKDVGPLMQIGLQPLIGKIGYIISENNHKKFKRFNVMIDSAKVLIWEIDLEVINILYIESTY